MKTSKQILTFEFIYCLSFLLCVFCSGNFSDSFHGLRLICQSSSHLVADYFVIGTVGGTFLNATLVGFSCIFLQLIFKANLSGTSLMAFFLTVGFSFFGINFLNIWPCFLGTLLFSIISKKSFSSNVNLALFSTSLAPFVSEMLFCYPGSYSVYSRIFLGILIGGASGFFLPILCLHGPNLHKGYSLYNAASVAGFIGIAFYSFLYRFRGIESPTQSIASVSYVPFGFLFCFGTCILMILVGFFMNGRSFRGYKSLIQSTGYQCDFISSFNVGLTLINIGIFGVFTGIYYVLIHAPLTSSTVGSMVCFLALASCGAHILNMLPIIFGYILISNFGFLALNAPAMIIGCCFSSSLVPISGKFGSISGIIAGMLHAIMVSTIVTFHGGFVLYNGGFTAGIVAIILLPVLEYFFIPNDALTLVPKIKPRN